MKKLVRGAALLAGLAILVVSATALAAPASANGLSTLSPIRPAIRSRSAPGMHLHPRTWTSSGSRLRGTGQALSSRWIWQPGCRARPVLVNGVNQYAWFWFLNTDPTTFPSGYPRVPGFGTAPEFALWVAWDGVQFTASIVDRRPTLTGGDSVFTPVGFSLNAAHISAYRGRGDHRRSCELWVPV